jgi:hypothetical protein
MLRPGLYELSGPVCSLYELLTNHISGDYNAIGQSSECRLAASYTVSYSVAYSRHARCSAFQLTVMNQAARTSTAYPRRCCHGLTGVLSCDLRWLAPAFTTGQTCHMTACPRHLQLPTSLPHPPLHTTRQCRRITCCPRWQPHTAPEHTPSAPGAPGTPPQSQPSCSGSPGSTRAPTHPASAAAPCRH